MRERERDWIVIGDSNQFPVLAFIVLETGQCGSDSKEVALWDAAGGGNDAVLWEMAKDNADSYGIYPRSEYADDEIDDENDYSDGIEGSAYLFHPDNLSSTHESAHQILTWLRDIEAITWLEGFSNIISINKEIISRSMNYDFESFCEMIEHNISGEFHIAENGVNGKSFVIGEAETEQRPVVVNRDRLFGKRDWNEGWTINNLITACRDSRMSELSLDEVLGGDLATSEIIVHDLIAYIRELEQR